MRRILAAHPVKTQRKQELLQVRAVADSIGKPTGGAETIWSDPKARLESQISQPYVLLSDDSTLILTVESPIDEIFYDTNYISSITEHYLVYRGFNSDKTMITLDSLIR